jgi:ubiquinone/menaquinone biosynthesis C-methylase UbiE
VDAKPNPDKASPFDDGELYDIICGDLNYGIDFYVGLAREAKGPVLDIACGTGRILLPCMQAGADMDGLDLAEGMLATLRKKAETLKLSPGLHQGDMSDFRLARRYALIMITFNAVIHNMTQEAQIRCFQRCREHLLPGGVLAFDTFFPGLAAIGAPENTRVLELETRHPQTGQTVRQYDTRTYDRVAQTQHSINDIEFLDAAGNVQTTHRSEFTTRFIYKEEMALLLRVAGFSRWEIYGDFEKRPLTNETDLQIVMAWS